VRILTVSNCPLSEATGSGYIVLGYTDRLRRLGHEVDLLGPEEYEPLRRYSRGRSYRQAVGMLRCAKGRISQKSYDVLEFYGGQSWLAIMCLDLVPHREFVLVSHANGLESHYLSTLEAHRRNGIPLPRRRWYQVDQSPLFERAYRFADVLVVPSEFEARFARERGYQGADSVVVIENPLPDDYIGVPIDFRRRHRIGFCGSWLPAKGTHAVMTDLQNILAECPRVSLSVVGCGTELVKEREFPAALWDRVDVVPFIQDKAALASFYQSLAILVLPSLFESFGLVVTEAMANGCAVVTTPVGFAADLRPDEEVKLMEGWGSPALYRAVRELLTDERLRLRIAKGGYRRVQSLRWREAASRLEQSLLESVERRRRRYATEERAD
jgi:glycosyltransferase involved in cell wall biosynthesis